MDIEAERAEVAANYLSTLNDLTCNSKLTINLLTMLAEESKDHGQIIVNTIKQHIFKVDSNLKLPLLYLIDSILKNVGDKAGCAYNKLFSHSIVHIFTGVFKEVNGEIRKRMLLLRRTWNAVFSSTKLYELDVCVNKIDPKWPIVKPKAVLPIHDRSKLQSLTLEQQQAELEKKQQELLQLRNLELAIRSKQIEAELTIQSNMLPAPQTNIKNQILAPPQQRMNSAEVSAARRRDPRLKHQLAIQQIQTESSQSINRSSVNGKSGHVRSCGLPQSTSHIQDPTSDSTSGTTSLSKTSKHTHSTHKSSNKSNSKASASTSTKRSSSNGRSSKSSNFFQKRSKSRRNDKLPHDDEPKDIDYSTEPVPGTRINSSAAASNDSKKRPSDATAIERPITKKTKSEKIDIFFGTEDVDLRVNQNVGENSSNARRSIKRSHSNDDGNEIFSSDSGCEAIRQSYRFPPKRLHQEDNKCNSTAIVGNTSTKSKSPIKENSTTVSKRRRARKTKWNSPWEERSQHPSPMQALPTNIIPNMSFPTIVPPTQPHALPVNNAVYDTAPDTMRQQSVGTYAWQQNGKPIMPNIAPPDSSNVGTAPIINISDLYQKLLATGILNNVKEASKKKSEKISPIALNKPETLKKRYVDVVGNLYSGRQCSSCGLRFPHEQTTKYSQHLDWHYRQNRRERDATRQANSRKWFYGMSDWIQYEEIENMDEREKNFFEAQQIADDSEHEDSNHATMTTTQPSCIAGPCDHNRACEMCHDAFEIFFHEDTEEWHLRNAVRFENTIFHPDCYNDYKISLTTADITTDLSKNDVSAINKNEKSTKSFEIVSTEGKTSTFVDGDDDVIIVSPNESIVKVMPDDEESKREQPPPTEPNESTEKNILVKTADTSSEDCGNNADSNENFNESDVHILEPNISILNLDDYVEKELPDNASALPIKIKEEPKYKGYAKYEEDAFEEVGTIEAMDMLNDANYEHIPAGITLSQPNTIVSMDCNAELQGSQPTTITTNKIKINISKNVHDKIIINSSDTVDPSGLIDTQALNVIDNDTNGCGDGDGNDVGIDESNIIVTTEKENIGGSNDIRSTNDTKIKFVVKESIRNVQFKPQPIVRSCVETSGLCSIM